jgi:hypothetical protein
MQCKECQSEMHDYGATEMKVEKAETLVLRVFCCRNPNCGHVAFKFVMARGAFT